MNFTRRPVCLTVSPVKTDCSLTSLIYGIPLAWHLIGAFVAITSSAALAADAAPPMRAMWVYRTEALLRGGASEAELLNFCAPRQITDLFLQAHFVAETRGGPFEIADAAAMRSLLREANARGLRVHALAGDPTHALRGNHDRVLARVEAFAAFNENSPAEARFAGLHFVIEPHGLPQWKSADAAQKANLLTQFVELNARVVERLHARAPGALYGADIAFWLDKTKSDGTPVLPVTFRGVTTDATRHLLGFVDHVAVMSYRDTAEGPNGIISLVARTISSADEARGRVFVGVKMADIGPRHESFHGRTEQEMNTELQKVDTAFRAHRGYAGLAYFMYSAFKEMARQPGAKERDRSGDAATRTR